MTTIHKLTNSSSYLKDTIQKVLINEYQLDSSIECSPISNEPIPLATLNIDINNEVSFILIINQSFPLRPPVVMLKHDDQVNQIDCSWDIELMVEDRIKQMIHTTIQAANGNKIYGTSNGLALTTDENTAHIAGWNSYFSDHNPEETRTEILEGIYARTLGVLSKDILNKRVLLIGIGSVGSYIADQLVRSGLGQLTVIDPDIVEYSNLSRTVYTLSDVNQPKVNALSRHLLNINPSIDLTYYEKDITEFDTEILSDLFQEADVIVAATDEPSAQRIINRFAYGTGKPAFFIGLYQGAEGGEVILSIPEKTPCYQCSTSIRHQLEENAGQVSSTTDYGTGKLSGEVALSADIHHVASSAVKLLLSMLIPEDSDVLLNGFASPAISKDLTYLTLSMKDQYWFYPHIFQDTPGQYAYQSVWLTPSRREDCPVCGDSDYRASLGIPLKSPSLSDIRKARG